MRKYIIRPIHFLNVISLSLLYLSGCASDKKKVYLEKPVPVWDTVESPTDVKMSILGRNLGPVYSLDISTDGKNLIAGSFRGKVKIWDLETGVEKLSLDQCLRPGVGRVAFSPDGRSFVVTGHNSGTYDQKVKLCDSTTGSELVKLDDSKEYCRVATFSEDGKYLIGLDNIAGHNIRVWNIKNGKVMTSFPHRRPCPLSSVVGSTNGKWFFTRSSIESLISGEKVGQEQGSKLKCPWFGIFSPDGSLMAWRYPGGKIKLRNAQDGSEIMTISAHPERIISVAFSPSGKRIVSTGVDKTIKIWDVHTGLEIMTLHGHEDMVFCALFSLDGTKLFSSSRDGTVRVWELNNQESD